MSASGWPLHPPAAPPLAAPVGSPAPGGPPLPLTLGTPTGNPSGNAEGALTGRPAPPRRRLAGLDVARLVAMVGMVIAHFVARDPAGGPLDSVRAFVNGRAMPLFVVLGGVGISLLTARASHPDRRLLTRAALLLPLGLLLQEWTVGIAIILQYYALYFVVAVGLRRLGDRTLLAAGALAVALGAVTYQVVGPRLDTYEEWAGWSSLTHPGRLAAALAVNGYYPLLPSLGFLVVGMWLGRRRLDDPAVAHRLLAVGLLAAVAGYGIGMTVGESLGAEGVVTDEATGRVVLSDGVAAGIAAEEGVSVAQIKEAVARAAQRDDDPDALVRGVADGYLARTPSFRAERLLDPAGHSQMPAWVLGATGVALAVIGACLLAARQFPKAIRPLATIGELALTFYVVQALAIRWTPDTADTSMPTEYLVSLLLVAGFSVLALLWRRRFAHGPLEAALRLGG